MMVKTVLLYKETDELGRSRNMGVNPDPVDLFRLMEAEW